MTKLINTLLGLIVLALMFILIVPIFFSGSVAVVLTGSMEPRLPVGSLAFSLPVIPEEIKVGDIIAFEFSSDTTVSHRVVEVLRHPELAFRTKGDANNEVDPIVTPAEDVRGRVIFSVPYVGYGLGYVLNYVKNWLGLVFLVCLPAIALIVNTSRDVSTARSVRGRRLKVLRKRQHRRKR